MIYRSYKTYISFIKHMDNQTSESKNYKKLFLFGGVFIAIAVIVFIIFILFSGKANLVNQLAKKSVEQPAQSQNGGNSGGKAVVKSKLKENAMDENALKEIASSFAERLGSFSNQSNFGNISDLKIFMTDKMKDWADNYITVQKEKKLDASTYFGVTAKALSVQTVSYNDFEDKAEFIVKTQKRAMNETSELRTYYQDLSIKFVKDEGIWKVDSAEWVK